MIVLTYIKQKQNTNDIHVLPLIMCLVVDILLKIQIYGLPLHTKIIYQIEIFTRRCNIEHVKFKHTCVTQIH